MNRGRDAEQQQVVDLDRGLFWIRYQGADDEVSPPSVQVSAAPGHEDNVELILHPDADDAVLWQPGSSLAVRIAERARLHVTVTAQRANGSRAASVKVETITQGARRRPASPRQGKSGHLEILGHVAGMGDVVVGPNDWIAGPTTPARIEGISLAWYDKPGDVNVRYAVKSPGQVGNPRLVDLATFSGTRGRALPVTGLVLELSGRGAPHFQFVVEALFLSSPTVRAVGQKVLLAGPTGREPLVGLRMEIQETDKFEAAAPAQLSATARPASSSTNRVRVFRSKPKQDEPSE